MTLEDIQKKYGVKPLEKGYAKAFISSLKNDLGQNDAIGDYKYFEVSVKFDGISIERVRAKNPDEAGRFAVRNVKDRCSGVSGNAKVNAKVSKTELA